MILAQLVEIPGDGRLIVDTEELPFTIGPEAVIRSDGGITSVTVTIPCLAASVATNLEPDDDEPVADAAKARLAAKGPQR